VGRLYEDAGDGYGEWSTTTATLRGDSLKLARAGSYAAARKVAALEFLPGRLPREVRVGKGTVLLPSAHPLDGHAFVLLPPSEDVEEFTFAP
jgi:hypothetical protein